MLASLPSVTCEKGIEAEFNAMTGVALAETAYLCLSIQVCSKPGSLSPDFQEKNSLVWIRLLTFADYIVLLVFTVVIISICSFRIIYQLRASFSVADAATRNLQKRIFTLLLLQFFVPVVCFSLPSILQVIFLCLGIPTVSLENVTTGLIGSSAIIEPVLILFFVKKYRSTVKKLFCRAETQSVNDLTLPKM